MSRVGQKDWERDPLASRETPGARDIKEPDAAWQFLQNLVLVGVIQPRDDEIKRMILASPPTGPKAS
jgi:hypothetical protein